MSSTRLPDALPGNIYFRMMSSTSPGVGETIRHLDPDFKKNGFEITKTGSFTRLLVQISKPDLLTLE